MLVQPLGHCARLGGVVAQLRLGLRDGSLVIPGAQPAPLQLPQGAVPSLDGFFHARLLDWRTGDSAGIPHWFSQSGSNDHAILNRMIAGSALAIGAKRVTHNTRHDAHIMVHLALVNFCK